MRWSDERYVKVYTRDSGEWAMVSWQAKGLFYELMRKCDAAGLIFLGRHGLKGLASLLRAPLAEFKPFLDELIGDGCVVLDGSYLVLRNFIAAQEAKASDKVRKQHERETDRARAVLEARQNAEAYEINQGECHADKLDGHAVLTNPTQPNPTHPTGQKAEANASGPWERVVGVWERTCVPVGFAPARGTSAQKKKAATRMREAGWFDAFQAACEFVAVTPFYRGANDRGWAATLGWFLDPNNSEKTAERAGTRRAQPAGKTDDRDQPLLRALAEAEADHRSGRDYRPDDSGGGGAGGAGGGGEGGAPALDVAAVGTSLSAAVGAHLVHRRTARQLQDAAHVELRGGSR